MSRARLKLRDARRWAAVHLPLVFSALVFLAVAIASPAQAQTGTIEFGLPVFSVYENGTNAIVVVTRSGNVSDVVTVQYSTSDGTAQDVQDYIGVSGTLTFNANEVVKTFTIPLVDNSLPEPDETLTVTLSNPNGALLGAQSTAQVVIFDDDTEIFFSQPNYLVREDVGNAVLTLVRNPVSEAPASVQVFTTTNGTATENIDYFNVATNILFTNGQSSALVFLPIVNDCEIETNETIVLTLTNAIGARIGIPSTPIVTITNDDTGSGTLEFNQIGPITTFEGDRRTIQLSVARRCANTNAVSINFGIVNNALLFAFCHGTTNAENGLDYTFPGTNVLNWAAGDMTPKTIDIGILEDTEVELTESIWVQLFNPTGGATLGTNSMIEIQIVDNDLTAGAANPFHNFQTVENPSPGANNAVYAIAPYLAASNSANFGKAILGGEFTAVNTVLRQGIARVNFDGTVDTTFDPGSGADGFVGAVAIQNDNKVLVAGGFTSIDNISRHGVARLNANGSLDATFNPGAGTDGPVLALGIQSDGKIVIAGDFANYNNIPRNRVARVNADGSLDPSFNPGAGPDSVVYSLDVQGDDKIVLGGAFGFVDGQISSGIARLNTDGTVDPNFDLLAGADNTVFAVKIQPDGKILMGGAFASYDGDSRRGIARLNTNGVLDVTFNPGSGVDGVVYAVDLQADGKPLIGGDFIRFNGTVRTNLARLYANGVLDTTFMDNHYNRLQPGPNGFITAISYLRTTNVLVGGSFSAVGAGYTVLSILPRRNFAEIIGGSTQNFGNAPGNMELLSGTYAVDENVLGGVLNIRVRRSNGNLGAIRVRYSTVDGSAKAGRDYEAASGFLTWDQCEAVDQFFAVKINNNDQVDGNRTFKIVLSNPESLGPIVTNSPALGFFSSADVTIISEDVDRGGIGFANAIFTVDENTPTRKATISLTRTNGSSGRATVQYATSNGTATSPADYAATNNTVTFNSGDTLKTFTIDIVNDTATEFDETINLRLFDVSGASLGRTNATLVIFDNENGHGSISFTTNEFTINESAGTATITLRRTSGTLDKVFVDVITSDLPAGPGAAREGVDYTGVTNTIIFSDGVSSRTVTIPIIPDNLVEGNEFFNIVLTNVQGGATIGFVSAAKVKIVEDDSYGQLSFTDPNLYFNEEDGSAVITVQRTGGSAEEVSVDFVLQAGTATEGVDYAVTNGTLVFADGVLSQTFEIPIVNDAFLELTETIHLVLTNFAKATPGAFPEATLNIIDDEALRAPAGSVDTFFDPTPGPNNFVNAIALLGDGRIYIGGDFTAVNNVNRRRVARLFSDGSLDSGFNPGTGANDSVIALALQSDGKVLLGGRFSSIGNRNRAGIARLTETGVLDTSFNPGSGADNPVLAIAVQDDGKILIGGDFTTYNGVGRNRIARLTSNGALDTTFNPANGADGTVQAVAIQPDGKIIVAGDFSDFNSSPVHFIVRLNPDGTRDGSFQVASGPDGFVHTMSLQADGKIVIGGAFSFVGSTPRNRIARLNSDGTLDISFDPGQGGDGAVFALALQADGKVIVCGEFTHFNGVSRNRIVRLNTNGSMDLGINFGSGANSFITATVIQPDAQILIGGGFTEVNGIPRHYIARLIGGADVGPGSLEFSAANYLTREGTNAAVQIVRSGGTTGQLDVDFLTQNGTAIATKDYTPVTAHITFLDGESVKTVFVPILEDTLVEPDETISLVLTNISGEGSLGPQSTATITIINDDARVGFTTANFLVNENVIGGQASVTIERVGTTNGTVSVDFMTLTNGSASAGLDYQPKVTTVVFPPGVTTQLVTISILDDAIVEGTETIGLLLTNLTGRAILSPANANLNIIDNDFNPGVLAFTASEYLVSEDATALTITVVRTNGTTGVVTFDYTTQDGTASAGLDYLATSGRVTIGDGQVGGQFTIPILDDFIIEGNETFQVTISNPTGGATFAGPTTALAIIQENDFGPGSIDISFNPGAGANGRVRSIALAPDGKVIVGGSFTNFDGTNRQYVARLNANGSHDLGFDPGVGPNSIVLAVDTISDGRIMVAGGFTTYRGVSSSRIARLNTNGTLDLSFSVPTFNAAINSIDRQNIDIVKDRIVAGGGFTTPTRGVAQLRLNGSSDTSFNPGTGANGNVLAVYAMPDGKVVLGGAFTAVDFLGTKRVARMAIDNNGQSFVDTGFVVDTITNGTVYAVAVQNDGKVIVGGDFFLNTSGTRINLARFNTDGTLDSSFNPGTGASGPVYALGLQTNGKIVVGGDFLAINGLTRMHYARLLPNGTVDSSFDPGNGANGIVYSIAMLPSNDFLIGGEFTSVNGVPRGGVARIRSSDQVARLTGVLVQGFQSRITTLCTPGVNYILETSTNLANWLPIRTNNASGNTLEFVDPAISGYKMKFYRVRQAGF